MTKKICIRENDLNEEIMRARSLIKGSQLPLLLSKIEPGYYGIARTHLDLLEILEIYLALIIETGKCLRNLILADKSKGFNFELAISEEDNKFINLFSLFAAGAEASDRADRLIGGVVRAVHTFNLERIWSLVSTPLDVFASAVIGDIISFITRHIEHLDPLKRLDSAQKTLNCACAYFKLMNNSIGDIAKDSAYECYNRAMREADISIMGKRFEGFSLIRADFSEEGNLIPVTHEEIIGNRDFLQAGIKLAKEVAGFDFVEGKNPKKINPVLFVLGKPGCGKTVSAHAIGNFFLNYCREREIKASFVIIRRTDWASSYQNASAQQLIQIFREKVQDFDGVVGVYWPDIDTAFAARGDPGLRSEEKNILGAAFGIFDGTIIPRNGKWFMICDANFMNMDKATVSRITQNPYYVRGPEREEDFIKLMRDIKLKEHREFIKISDGEWLEFGKKCTKHDLSGRSIENISRKIISEIEDFEFPEEYYKSDYKRKKEIIRENSKTMEFLRFMEIIENYLRFEKEAEERAYRERFQDRVDEIISNLSARQFVMKKFSGEGLSIE